MRQQITEVLGWETNSSHICLHKQPKNRNPPECSVIRMRSQNLSRKGGTRLELTMTPHLVLPIPDRLFKASPAASVPLHSFTPFLVLLSLVGSIH